MQKTLLFLWVTWLSLMAGPLSAQTVTGSLTGQNLSLCGPSAPLTFSYTNNVNAPLSGVSIQLVLPACIRYVTGSIVGTGMSVTGVNTTTNTVSISAPTLAVGATGSFTIQVNALCGTPCGSSWNATATLASSGGSTTITSPLYNLQSPSLSQTVSPINQPASVGASFQRCVTVTNGGLGALTSFTVVVNSAPGSLNDTLFTASGNPIAAVTSGNNQTLTIGASQIQAVGDGDALFEQNESIQICYQVNVVDCISLTSNITTTWGCGGQTCGSTTTATSVVVTPGTPSIVATHQHTPTYCHGGGNVNTLTITLTNNGTGPARDVMVQVRQATNLSTPPDASLMSSIDSTTIRLVDALGNTVTVMPDSLKVGTTPSHMNACFPNNKSTTAIWVRIPLIAAGSNVGLVVDQKSCCKTWCEGSVTGGLIYQVNYMNQCRTVSYLVNPVIGGPLRYARVTSITRNGPTALVGSTPGSYELVHSNFLLLPSLTGARVEVSLTIPAGLIVDPNSIRFEYPAGGTAWMPSATPTMVNATTMRALFPWPAPSSQLEKIELRFSLIADCSTGPCSSGPKAVTYQIHQIPDTSCACRVLLACHNFSVTTHCGICPGTCPNGGMIFTGFDVYRTTYGQNDTPDNGVPDPGPLTPPVRSQYVMFGDIFETKFKGVVATTAANPSWPRGVARSTIGNGNYLTSLSYHVRIKDQSTGLTYQGTMPGVAAGAPATTFTYSLDTVNLQAALALPSGFAYEDGDSVEVTARYRVSDNFPGASTQSISNTFTLQNASGSLAAGCDNFSGTVTLVGYYYTTGSYDMFNHTGCGDVQINQSCNLSIGPCCDNDQGGNIFRNEFRHWGVPKRCTVTLPAGYSFVPGSATFRHYRTAGTNMWAWLALPVTPSSVASNSLVFDLEALYPALLTASGGEGDDGYEGLLILSIRPSCAVAPLVRQAIKYEWEFAPVPQLTGPNSAAPYKTTNDTIVYRPPQLLITPPPTVSGTASTVTWTVPVSNQSNVAHSTNTWMALVSPTGLVQPTTVQVAGGPAITPVGGIYYLDTLPFNSTQSYQITATYSNCSVDSLRVLVGWDCNGYPSSLAANPCVATSATLIVQPAPTALQATLTVTPSTIGICDSFTVEAVVVATQPGYVLDLGLQVNLPLTNGLSYQPGSSSLFNPVSGSYVPLGNPTISGNQLTWLSSLVNLPDTLPGVNQTGPNTFRIRFRLRSNCNMISGDQLRMDVLGTRTCGTPLPPVPVLSNPITVTGATPAYTTQISTTVTDVNVCTRGKRLTIRMRKIGTVVVAAGDSIAVNLPAGNTYLGGFTATTNPPATNTPTILIGPGGSHLTWPIAAGLANGDSMVFSFDVKVPCGTSLVTVQSLNVANLTCGVTTCPSFVQTGGALLSFTVAQPNLAVTATSATYQYVFNAATVQYTVNIQNTGTPIAAGIPIVLQTYCDTDGSGTWTPQDQPYNSQTYVGGLVGSASLILKDTFNVPNSACPDGRTLFFVVQPNDAAGLCLCGTGTGSITPLLPVEWGSVSGEVLPLSNAVHWEATVLPGHDYFVLERARENGWEDVSAPIRGVQPSYTAHDSTPPAVGRYRVRAHDIDGKTSHSSVVELMRMDDGVHITLFPNPVGGEATVSVRCASCPTGAAVRAELTDLNGKLIDRFETVLENGACDYLLDMEDYPAGSYFLRIAGKDFATQVLRVMHQ